MTHTGSLTSQVELNGQEKMPALSLAEENSIIITNVKSPGINVGLQSSDQLIGKVLKDYLGAKDSITSTLCQ